MMAQLEAPPAIRGAQQAVQDDPQPASSAPAVEQVADPLREHAHLADVPLRVEAVLDRLTMSMLAVASLEKGAVLTLGRSAGDNVDLYVCGVKLASGEIVVIENTLGVRITDLLTGE
jgi:flagellar motor switch protein FliN/FliY